MCVVCAYLSFHYKIILAINREMTFQNDEGALDGRINDTGIHQLGSLVDFENCEYCYCFT